MATYDFEKLLASKSQNARRKKHLLFKLVAISMLIICTLLILNFYLTILPESSLLKKLGFASMDLWQLMMGVGVLVALAGVMRYLQPTINDGSRLYARERKFSNEDLRDIYSRIFEAELALDSLASKAEEQKYSQALSEEEKNNLKDALAKRLIDESQADFIAGIKEKVLSIWKAKQIEEIFTNTVKRLERELGDQARRGNVNLVLGIFTTLVGVAILGYSVFQAPILQSTMDVVSHFLPRLSLVVLVEVFAYFFLRLYKQGLAEIKYFQNEITNIESKYLALLVSMNYEVDDGVLKAVDRLLLTERNFILEKGQSTVDLENKKGERAASASLINDLAQMVTAIKKS